LEEGEAFVMNASTWVDIVSTAQSGAEPGCAESKHTCNAIIKNAQAFLVLKIIGSSD